MSKYSYFTYPNMTGPGKLCICKECQACFYYYLLCSNSIEKIGKHIEDQFGLLDDFLWMDLNYRNIAIGVAKMYELVTPDDFLIHKDHVLQVISLYDMPESDHVIFSPHKLER